MGKYRKKPVTINAFQWFRVTPMKSIPKWLRKAIKDDRITLDRNNGVIIIDTLEGQHISKPGDYIIEGVKGELYPCKPDIFEMIYEKVVDKDEEE